MNPTDVKKVRIVPREPRFISDILKSPKRIDSEIELDLNVKEIIRCMQYADVYEGDTILTPENFNLMTEEDEEDSDAGQSQEEGATVTTNELVYRFLYKGNSKSRFEMAKLEHISTVKIENDD